MVDSKRKFGNAFKAEISRIGDAYSKGIIGENNGGQAEDVFLNHVDYNDGTIGPTNLIIENFWAFLPALRGATSAGVKSAITGITIDGGKTNNATDGNDGKDDWRINSNTPGTKGGYSEEEVAKIFANFVVKGYRREDLDLVGSDISVLSGRRPSNGSALEGSKAIADSNKINELRDNFNSQLSAIPQAELVDGATKTPIGVEEAREWLIKLNSIKAIALPSTADGSSYLGYNGGTPAGYQDNWATKSSQDIIEALVRIYSRGIKPSDLSIAGNTIEVLQNRTADNRGTVTGTANIIGSAQILNDTAAAVAGVAPGGPLVAAGGGFNQIEAFYNTLFLSWEEGVKRICGAWGTTGPDIVVTQARRAQVAKSWLNKCSEISRMVSGEGTKKFVVPADGTATTASTFALHATQMDNFSNTGANYSLKQKAQIFSKIMANGWETTDISVEGNDIIISESKNPKKKKIVGVWGIINANKVQLLLEQAKSVDDEGKAWDSYSSVEFATTQDLRDLIFNNAGLTNHADPRENMERIKKTQEILRKIKNISTWDNSLNAELTVGSAAGDSALKVACQVLNASGDFVQLALQKLSMLRTQDWQGTGNQGTGNQGTGNQGTGNQGTGNQGTGNQGTGITNEKDASTIERATERVNSLLNNIRGKKLNKADEENIRREIESLRNIRDEVVTSDSAIRSIENLINTLEGRLNPEAPVVVLPEENAGNQGTGNQGTGNQGTGNQGTGNQGTGNQGTGNQGTGSKEEIIFGISSTLTTKGIDNKNRLRNLLKQLGDTSKNLNLDTKSIEAFKVSLQSVSREKLQVIKNKIDSWKDDNEWKFITNDKPWYKTTTTYIVGGGLVLALIGGAIWWWISKSKTESDSAEEEEA